ncbi:MAG TPA: hypothetical protein VHO70_06430 [Chitinispirillaceae bacterium]|nr:hypothetical protein [Chitinispirillaceae bacterium]
MNCFKCGKMVGKLSNYGDNDKPVCYDCASLQYCEECKDSISVGEHVTSGTRLLCRKCQSLALQNDTVRETEHSEENNVSPEEVIRFDTDPFYSLLMLSLSLILLTLLILNQLHVYTCEMVDSYIITIVLTIAFFITLILRIKMVKNHGLIITGDSLRIGKCIIYTKDITLVDFTENQIVTFCYTQNGIKRKRTVYVNSIATEQQEQFRLWVKELQFIVNSKK